MSLPNGFFPNVSNICNTLSSVEYIKALTETFIKDFGVKFVQIPKVPSACKLKLPTHQNRSTKHYRKTYSFPTVDMYSKYLEFVAIPPDTKKYHFIDLRMLSIVAEWDIADSICW